MQETTTQVRKEEIVTAYVCDCCGKREEAAEETQEWLSWRHRGGYLSMFGDGDELSLDLCQECTKAHLGAFVRKLGNTYGG